MLWGALAFCLAALLGSGTYAGVRGWSLWRALRDTTGRTTRALERVASTAAAVEARALAVSDGGARLARAADRLQRALAELDVVRAAAAEPRALLRSVRGVVPRK